MSEQPVIDPATSHDLGVEKVFRAFHGACRTCRIAQPRILINQDNELGPVLFISYHACLNTSKRLEELGTVMDAAATTAVVLAQAGVTVTGGIAIVAHDGNGRPVYQAVVATADAAAFVAKRIDKKQFIEAWTIR